MHDLNLHKNILSKLQEYGFEIEMDDFGSGYSSLNVLTKLNMDVLKIDMGFLRKSQNEENSRAILSSIVSMAKSLGMTIVCEGVETQSQSIFLKTIGVDIFQGYYYSRPVSVEDFTKQFLEADK